MFDLTVGCPELTEALSEQRKAALAAYWAGSISASVARSVKRVNRFGNKRPLIMQVAAFGAPGLALRIVVKPGRGIVGATCIALMAYRLIDLNVTCWPR